VKQDYRNPPAPGDPDEGLSKSNDIEDFFQKMSGNFRWPKPDAESVAAAVEAVHRMSSEALPNALAANPAERAESNCPACGGVLPGLGRFCVWCGVAAKGASEAPPQQQNASEQHHVHHHYHHLVPGVGSASSASADQTVAARGRVPGPVSTMAGGRAEVAARQVVQDWAQACNTKHIDDLLDLYSADATVIRSSVPPVRTLPAIRAFLISLLEAGLGDVEMESLRLEVMGDIALDLGRCKMLVPVAMGKRREERGKYLVVLVRQPAGTWKILADSWSADLSVNAPLSETAGRNSSDPVRPSPPAGRPR
jgi:ketosteroid isomerase-like protein